MANPMVALTINGLEKSFGGIRVTRGVSLNVEAGERRLIIGPNGAGKTTLFNLITGEIKPDRGSIKLFGTELNRLSVATRVHLGMSRTYQIINLFPKDTLLHNVSLAITGLSKRRWNPFLPFGQDPKTIAQAEEALDRVGLIQKSRHRLLETSYGERRRIEIAMALAQRPKLLLLDEPFAGLSIDERKQVHHLIMSIPTNITVIMIEHDMEVALDYAETIAVMHFGQVVMDGTRREVIEDDRAKEIYLGQ